MYGKAAGTFDVKQRFPCIGARQGQFARSVKIERIVSDIRSYSAAVAGMPSKDTVKLADAAGFASVTPERAHVWMIQTPQGFTYPLIRAHAASIEALS